MAYSQNSLGPDAKGLCRTVIAGVSSQVEPRCSPQQECWTNVQVNAAQPVACARRHDYETYVLGTLRPDTNPHTLPAVRADARVKLLCTPELFGPAARAAGVESTGWRFLVLGPLAPDALGLDQRTFRCLVGRPGGSTGSIGTR